MSFQQGLSGLNVAAKSLDVIGNNIANAGVTGFKASTAQFADVFASSLLGAGAGAVGIGAQLSSISPQFTQGNINVTNNPLDVAVNGRGFFRMSDSGSISYSRDGHFHIDKDGYVVNPAGLRLTGYAADANGNILPSSPVDLMVSSSDLAPRVTSSVDAVLNLDSRETQPATAVFDPSDPTSYNNSTSVSLYDSLGNPHILSLYFVKTAVSNGWNVYADMDGAGTAYVNLGAGAGSPVAMTFSTAGVLIAPAAAVSASLDLSGAATALGNVNGATSPLAFSLDFAGSTQFGSAFGVNSLSQDGYGSGRLSGLAIGSDGVIQGRYTNGQSRDLGQVVLVNFNNVQGLAPLGSNQWGETPDGGTPLVGAPGTGNLGVLQSSAVEESNVDLTAELVNMITMQRIYQANAQTIKTQDAVLQTLVNLR